MKKRLVCLWIVLIALMQSVCAGNVQQVFDEFKKVNHADYVSISPFLMKLGMMFAGTGDETDQIARKVKSLKVLDLEDCSAEVKQRFSQRIARLNEDGYETLMRINDSGEKVNILIKTKKETIREMLIVCNGPEDYCLILLKGKFKASDIDALVEQQTGKQHT